MRAEACRGPLLRGLPKRSVGKKWEFQEKKSDVQNCLIRVCAKQYLILLYCKLATATMDIEKKQKGYLRGVTYWLTFPKSEVTAAELLANITAFFGQLLWAIVGAEKHQDGTDHLHAVIKHKQAVYTNFERLDELTGKRGNYQCARNIKKVVDYCTKDGEYVSHGIDVNTFKAATKANASTVSSLICKMIDEGCDICAIAAQFPGYILMHRKKVEDFMSWRKRMVAITPTMDWDTNIQEVVPIIDMRGDVMWRDDLQVINQWLYENVKQEREFRQHQLYIYGPPRSGKTEFFKRMETMLKIYWVPK